MRGPDAAANRGIVLGDFKISRGIAVLGDDEFVPAPGQHLEQDFHFVRRRLKIRVLTADGKEPVAGLVCHVAGASIMTQRTTDAEGWIVLDPAPSGKIRVDARKGRRFIKLGSFAVPTDKKEAVVELRLMAVK